MLIPDIRGHGIGRALVEQAKAWAVSKGLEALTLTTFVHIPWNRPLYEHLGFRVLSQAELGPRLQELRDAEARHGLALDLRVAMRLDL